MREKGILKLLVILVILAIVASSSTANLENCCIEIDEKGIDEGGGKGIVSLLLPFFIGVTGGTVVDFAPQATAHEEETPTPVGSLPYVPTWIEYQGRFVDAEGQPFNGTVNMTFSIYDAAEGGTKLWGPEQHTNVTVSDSIFNVTLGQSERLPSEVLTGATWMEFGINGEVQTPRKNGLYALYASWADTVGSFHVPGPEKSVDSCYGSKNEYNDATVIVGNNISSSIDAQRKNESAEATTTVGNNMSSSIDAQRKNESAEATAIVGNNMSSSIDAQRKNESAETTAIVGNDTSGSIGLASESANTIGVYSTSDANKPAVYILSIRNIMPEYQDRLVDTEGNPLSGTVNMTFSIYDAAEGGTRLWGPEDHTNVKVSDGFFSVTLRIPSGVLTGATWMEVAANGVVWTPRRSGLYALYASWADNADNADNADTVDGFHVSSPGPSLDTRYNARYVNEPHDRMKSKYDTGPILTVTNLGAKGAILGTTGAKGANVAAIEGNNTGGGSGVLGTTAAADADVAAIVGDNTGGGIGMLGTTGSDNVTVAAIVGHNTGNGIGVLGATGSNNVTVAAIAGHNTGNGIGVWGTTISNQPAILGCNSAIALLGGGPGVEGRSLISYGVYGTTPSGSAAVYGYNTMPFPLLSGPGVKGKSEFGIGVYGETGAGGSSGVKGLTDSDYSAVHGENTAGGPGVEGESKNNVGVLAITTAPAANVPAIEARNNGGGIGVLVSKAGAEGVYIDDVGNDGIYIEKAGGNGVLIRKTVNDGFRVDTAAWDGVYVDEAGDDGVHVVKAEECGVRVDNAGDDGFQVDWANDDGLYVHNVGNDGVYVEGAGDDGVHVCSPEDDGVYVRNAGGDGFDVDKAGDNGVEIGTVGTDGVYINKTGNNGISINNAGRNGVAIAQAKSVGVFVGTTNENDGFRVNNAGNDGLEVEWANVDGVYVKGAGDDGVHVCSPKDDGVYIGNAGDDGVQVDWANADGLYVYNVGDDGIDIRSVGGDFIAAGPGTDRKFRVDNNGNVRTDGSFYCGARAPGCLKTGAADVAELVNTSEKLEPGDVVEIDPTQPGYFRLARTSNSTLVAGVISSNPAILMGVQGITVEGDEPEDDRPPLALAGRVRVKVSTENGPITVGDLLTTSCTPGHAMKATEPKLGTILGKALDELESDTGMIDVLVMLQ